MVAARRGHRFAEDATLDRYCASEHCVISLTGDPTGYVDGALAARGLRRSVSVTVPSVLLALALVGESDLIAALPRRLLTAEGDRFGVTGIEAPPPLGGFRIRMVAPRAALPDGGIAWLLQQLESIFHSHAAF